MLKVYNTYDGRKLSLNIQNVYLRIFRNVCDHAKVLHKNIFFTITQRNNLRINSQYHVFFVHAYRYHLNLGKHEYSLRQMVEAQRINLGVLIMA